MAMRLAITIGVLMNVLPALAQETKPAAPEKIRIAVADFAISGDVGIAEAGKSVSELLLTEFSTDKFQLIERSMLAALLKEKDLSISDIVENPALLKDKGVKGVRFLVLGKVVKLGNLSISARLVDVSTGEIARTAKVSAEDAKGLQNALGELAQQLQANDHERREMEELAPFRKLRTQIRVSANESGKLTLLGQAAQLDSRKTAATFTDVPCGQVLELRFTPAGGQATETFRVDLRHNRAAKLGCVLITAKTPVSCDREGVPYIEATPEANTPTSKPVVWNEAAKETACLAAILNTVRTMGGQLEVLDVRTDKEFAAWLKESNMAVRKEVDRYVFNGVTMLSETEFKDDVCQTDEMHAEFVVGDEPLMLNAKDFIIDSPRSPKDRSISRKAFDCLKAAGFSDFKEEYPADEYLCKVTMTFHGWMLFERK